MEALDIWCSNYTKLLYQHSNILREKAGECVRSLSTHVADTDEFRGNMSPQRIMEIVTLTNALEQKACHDTDARKISEFFTAMNSLLEDNSLSARGAIDILIALSTSTGILLPFFRNPGSENSDIMSSTVSINTVLDEAEERNERLWAKICTRLSRSLLDQLAEMDIAESNTALTQEGCVEHLLVLNTSGAAWLSYKQLRTRQLDRLGQLTFRSDGEAAGGARSWGQLVAMPAQWRQYAATVRAMVESDVRVLHLFDVGNALDALVNLYLDFVCEEVRCFVEAVEACLAAPRPGQTRPGLSAGTGAAPAVLSGRSKRRVSPEAVGAAQDAEEAGVLDMEALLLVVDTLSSWCQLEAHLMQIVNDFWSADTIGLDFEAGACHVFATGVAATGQKPKGVLKKLRRNSRRPSAHLMGPGPGPGGEERSPAVPLSVADLLAAVRNSSESPQVQEGSAAIQPYLEWQGELEAVFPTLARAVEAHLVALWRRVRLTDDQQTAANSFGQKYCSLQDSPQIISSGLWDYLHLAERLVPLLAEGCQTEEGGPEVQLLSAFCHTVSEHLGAALETLHHVLNESGNFDQLVMVLANVQCLQDTCFRLGLMFMAKDEESGSSFWDWRKRLSETIPALVEHLERQWAHHLATAILQDAESHHWADGKEFYEDERVSMGVQFWRLSLVRLWQRLSSTCSPDLARQVQRRVLLASVRILRQRYLNARPQPRRLQQFRADLIAIMTAAEDFLCRCTTALEPLLGIDDDLFSVTRAIHTEMMGLVHVLVVVASPIADFYAVHRKGFYRAVASSELATDENNFCVAFWLGLVKSELYPSCLKARSVRDMLATNAICVQLRLLCSSPVPHNGMVLRILSMCDAALSVLLVSQAPPSQARELYTALFRVFAHLPTLAPGKLSRLVVAAVKSCNDFSVFSEFYHASRAEAPAFLDALLAVMEPYTAKAVEALQAMLRRPEADLAAWLERLRLAEALPCGCRFECAHAGAMQAAAVGAELGAVAEALGAELFALPEALRHAVAVLQALLEEQGVRPAGGHAALHLLLHACLRRLRGLAKARAPHVPASRVQALWAALKQKVHDLPSLGGVVALALSGVTLEDAMDFSQITDGNDYEALRQRQALITATRDATAQPTVCEELKYLYFFLKRNERWIFANMGFGASAEAAEAPDEAGAEGSLPSPAMQLDIRPREASPQFSLVTANREFSVDSERMTRILDTPGIWPQLVANTHLGVARPAFLSLMAHRPDFVTDAFLDEHQRRQVEELREKFHVG